MIELIMVIVIASILAASARALLNTEAFDQRFFADDALQALRYAHQLAATQGCAVEFQLLNGDGFYLRQDENCNNSSAISFPASTFVSRPNDSDDYSNTDWPSGVSASPVNFTQVFYPQGWACNAAGTDNTENSLTLTSSFTITLNLVCATGFSYES